MGEWERGRVGEREEKGKGERGREEERERERDSVYEMNKVQSESSHLRNHLHLYFSGLCRRGQTQLIVADSVRMQEQCRCGLIWGRLSSSEKGSRKNVCEIVPIEKIRSASVQSTLGKTCLTFK